MLLGVDKEPRFYGFFFSGFTLKGEQSFQQGRQMYSHEGEEEHYSKLTKGEGNPESLQRGN